MTTISTEEKFIHLLNPQRFRKTSSKIEDFGYNHPFESDLFRIATSAPLRRLQDKTQVFPQEKVDFVRRRLTHSMEVATVGRRMGQMVEFALQAKGMFTKNGQYETNFINSIPTILETAGLVHDIGNPPFGHFGEETIQQYFKNLNKSDATTRQQLIKSNGILYYKDHNKESKLSISVSQFAELTEKPSDIIARAFHALPDTKDQPCRSDFMNFDGNVQGFRVLRHLGLSSDDNSFNLTMPTLATVIKYPHSSFKGENTWKTNHHEDEKCGFYFSEKESYNQICAELKMQPYRRHPLVYLLEAADDIVNVTSDVEDGFKQGIITFQEIKDKISFLCDEYHDVRFETIEEKLNEQQKESRKITPPNITDELRVKEFRIRAVHKLMEEAVNVFVSHFEEFVNAAFEVQYKDSEYIGEELLKANSLREKLTELQMRVVSSSKILKSEILGEHVITELLNKFVGCMFCDEITKLDEEHEQDQSKYTLSSKTLEGKLYALISPNYKRAHGCKNDEVPKDPYHRFLLAVDHVSGMTDSYAVDLYNLLTNKKN